MPEVKDAVVEAVREDLLRRSQLGIAKYGVTLERTDLALKGWLQHAYEEVLDTANYLKRTIIEIERSEVAMKEVYEQIHGGDGVEAKFARLKDIVNGKR